MDLPTVPHMVQDGTDNSSVYKYSVQTQHSSHQLLMMETERVSETSHTNSTLTRLITQQDFIVSSVQLPIHILPQVKLNMS
jgi:hypothetical protein